MGSLYILFVTSPLILEHEFSLTHLELGLFFAKTDLYLARRYA